MKKSKGVPVSVRALTQRVNRKLAGRGEKLKTTRSDRWRDSLGDYYTIHVARNVIVARNVDLEALGRELGVLQPWESVAEE